MFFRKQERKRVNPWCVIVIGGLAVVGAVSLTNMGRDFIKEKSAAIASFLKGKSKPECECGIMENI